MPDTSSGVNRHCDEEQGSQNWSKKTKKKPAPTRSSGALTAGPSQEPEPQQPMPVYAQVTKRRRSPKSGQPNKVSSSMEALIDSATSSRTLTGNDGEVSRTGGATAFKGKVGNIPRGQSEVVYSDVFNSLPRVPNVDPSARNRGRSILDSAFYADVYHTLNTVKTRAPSAGAALQCSDESGETYGDILAAARDAYSNSRRRELPANGDFPLNRCHLYGEGHEGSHTSRTGPGESVVHHGRRSTEVSLYAEVNDEGLVASNDSTSTHPRRYLYMKASERDCSGEGSCVTARTSYLYAEVSDFSIPSKQDNVRQKTTTPKREDRQVPFHTTVTRKQVIITARTPRPEDGFH